MAAVPAECNTITRPHLGVVFIGHVDSGKTTLVGRLLYEILQILPPNARGKLGSVMLHFNEEVAVTRTMYFESSSRQIYRRFSRLAHATKEEFERGITLNFHAETVSTPTLDLTLVDSPGHRDFIKNMYAGLILADCAVLVVAAPPGEYESGLYFGQTPEHAKLAYISGIKDFVVCVTKIDQVPFADVEARFNKIVVDITAMLTKIGKVNIVRFIPLDSTSANIVTSVPGTNSWYIGPSLFEALHTVSVPQKSDLPTRLCIAQVFAKTNFTHDLILMGKVFSGSIQKGMKLVCEPEHIYGRAKRIMVNNEEAETARPGDTVTIHFDATKSSPICHRGSLVGLSSNRPPKNVSAIIAVIYLTRTHIKIGYSPSFHCHSTHCGCTLSMFHAILDATSDTVLKERPLLLAKGDKAEVTIAFHKPISLDPFPSRFGRFVLRDNRMSVALGIVKRITQVGYLPRWSEVKPLLVGWKKDPGSYLFNTKIPLDVLVLIIEFAWEVTLPSLLL